ncbi:MAG: hypothetical protein H6732_08940 [Alphaproteobacteria bacterium]|nr:hypothetical protein [Alphaproteobacteria bacterium]
MGAWSTFPNLRGLGACTAAALAFGACSAGPERQPLDTFPSAADETDAPPVGNDCRTRTHGFSVDASGYLTGTVSGYGSFVYQPTPENRTTILLQVCSNGVTPQILDLSYFGVGRLKRGRYDITEAAQEVTGFLFGFADEGMNPVACTWKPSGWVEITSARFDGIEGEFEVTVGCVDEAIKGDREPPAEAVFKGRFAARDVGQG